MAVSRIQTSPSEYLRQWASGPVRWLTCVVFRHDWNDDIKLWVTQDPEGAEQRIREATELKKKELEEAGRHYG